MNPGKILPGCLGVGEKGGALCAYKVYLVLKEYLWVLSNTRITSSV